MIKFLTFAAIMAALAWQVGGTAAATVEGRTAQINAAIDAASK